MDPGTEPPPKQRTNEEDARDPGRSPLLPLAAHGSKWRRLLGQVRGLPVLSTLLAITLLAKFVTCREQPLPRCREASLNASENVVLICDREYARTKNPATGAILADQLRRARNVAQAKEVAHGLRGTSAHAEALAVLGKIANAESRFDEAASLLEEAAELFSRAGNWKSAATTLLALANASLNQQAYLDALEQLARCVSLAQTAGASEVEASCHLGASRTLLELGDAAGAERELDQARTAGSPRLAAEAELVHANHLQESGRPFQSIPRFKKALATGLLSSRHVLYAHLDLAHSLIEADQLDEARLHLQTAKDLDTGKSLPASLPAIEGLLKSRSKDPKELEQADVLLAEAVSHMEPYEQDDKTETYMDRTDLALTRGDLASAIAYAKQTLTWIDEIRAKQLPRYRSWITQRYRRAYELLFLALARAGQAEEALHTIDRWQRQEALDRLLPSASALTAGGLKADWMNARELARVTRSLRTSAFAEPHDLPELRRQLGEEDLVALVVAREELWRLTAQRGVLRLHRLGDLPELAPRLLDRFRADPLEPESAAALGALLIPAEQAIATGRVLHVLLDAELADLPFEALRIGSQPVTQLRPVVRVLRPETGCIAPLPPHPSAVLIADPGGDLSHSRNAAAAIAKVIGANTETLIGSHATLHALERSAGLLHLFLHSAIDQGSGFLRMFDGDRRATDIAIRGSAPAAVMLFSCLSAVAKAGNYSIATAYLTAGAHQVVATLHEVSDKGAAEVASKFYSHGGARDPVRALARTQAELAVTKSNRDWYNFAVYGRQTCKESKAP